MNNPQLRATTWLNLTNITGERSQTQKNACCVILFIDSTKKTPGETNSMALEVKIMVNLGVGE